MQDIKVSDMTCMSCIKKIQTKLLTNGINAKFDVSTHTISVNTNETEKAVNIIKDAGYTPEI